MAGAVAIAVLHADTRASLNDRAAAASEDIEIAEDVEILSQATHVIETVASSAIGPDGRADDNSEAEANANGDAAGGDEPADTDAEQPEDYPDGGTPGGSSPSEANTTNARVGVGAAFALSYINIDMDAGVGENRTVNAGTLNIGADVQNRIKTAAVAGTDPLSGGGDAQKISIDAAVAVGLLYTDVNAYVKTGATVVTNGGSTLNLSDTEGEEFDDFVNTAVRANQRGETVTRASGFAIGISTAVGAAVAVNIAESNISAAFEGSGTIGGILKVTANTHNEDKCIGVATAMGADVQRYANKLSDAIGSAEDKVNAAAAGDYSGAEDTNSDNDTASAINEGLDGHSNSEQGGGSEATNNAPLSANVLGTLDASTEPNPDTSEATGTVSGSATDSDGNAVSPTSGANTASTASSQKIRVAAAVAINITAHCATATLNGNITAAAVSVLAANQGNFNAMGTGAAVSLDNGGNSVGVGVAISLNENQATAIIGGSVAATGDADTDGDITVSADLTQNMDDEFKGKLGAQALAGAVAGSSSRFCISGAVAIIVSKSATNAIVLSGAVLSGGDICVTAADKSKLAVRAGALSASKGASVGVGISFALIYAHNAVGATVQNGASITASSFTLTAQKLKVDFSDYSNAFDPGSILGISEVEGWEDNDEEDSEIYECDITFDTDSVLSFVDLANFLSSTNYYAEAISGAVNGGSGGKLSASGSFAMVFFYNDTIAQVGDGVTIALDGDMNVTAASDTTARIIAGAVTAGNTKVGVGVTVSVLNNEETVSARIGSGGHIEAGGKTSVDASADTDILVITVAVAATSGISVGGSISVILTENDVQATVGNNAVITANGGLDVISANKAYLLLLALSASASMGKAAMGGTVAVIITGNSALAAVGDGAVIECPDGSVNVSSDNDEALFSILASASGSTGGATVAGTVNVQLTRSAAAAKVGNGVTITAGGDIDITAVSKFADDDRARGSFCKRQQRGGGRGGERQPVQPQRGGIGRHRVNPYRGRRHRDSRSGQRLAAHRRDRGRAVFQHGHCGQHTRRDRPQYGFGDGRRLQRTCCRRHDRDHCRL